MHFVCDWVFHTVTRITGPTHNILALQLVTEFAVKEPNVQRLKRISKPNLDPQSLMEQVIAGVVEANGYFGTHYGIATLKYADDDTPPESIYRFLAFSLVERLANQLPFASASTPP